MQLCRTNSIALIVILTGWILASASFADPKEFEPQISFIGSESWTGFGSTSFSLDFNDDYSDDLLITDQGFNETRGKVHILMDIAEIPSGSYDMASYQTDIVILGDEPDDKIGRLSLSCDFNGDGVSDFVTVRFDWGGRDELMFILYGGDHWETGMVIDDLESNADVVIVPNVENEESFHYPFICDDIDGDGADDLLAGAYPVVILGGDFPSGTTLDLTASPPAVRFSNIEEYDLYYRFLADIDGDGRNDFLFSEESIQGAIRIWFGLEDYSSPIVIDPDVMPPDVEEEGPFWDAVYTLKDVGDWNGDGVADLLTYQTFSASNSRYDLRLGQEGMQPGHTMAYQFTVISHNALRIDDIRGTSDLDLVRWGELSQPMEFYWNREAFPQTGFWSLNNYDPQGTYYGPAWKGQVKSDFLDGDAVRDLVFHSYLANERLGQVDVYLSTRDPGDDDDDTGDDDTGDDDTGDDDTGDDDTGDDDTGDDDSGDDDTGDDDTGDDDTGPDDDDDTGPDDDDDNDDTGDDDDDTGLDDDDDDDDDGCCG